MRRILLLNGPAADAAPSAGPEPDRSRGRSRPPASPRPHRGPEPPAGEPAATPPWPNPWGPHLRGPRAWGRASPRDVRIPGSVGTEGTAGDPAASASRTGLPRVRCARPAPGRRAARASGRGPARTLVRSARVPARSTARRAGPRARDRHRAGRKSRPVPVLPSPAPLPADRGRRGHASPVTGAFARSSRMNSRIQPGLSGQARAETSGPSTTTSLSWKVPPAACTSSSSAG